MLLLLLSHVYAYVVSLSHRAPHSTLNFPRIHAPLCISVFSPCSLWFSPLKGAVAKVGAERRFFSVVVVVVVGETRGAA